MTFEFSSTYFSDGGFTNPRKKTKIDECGAQRVHAKPLPSFFFSYPASPIKTGLFFVRRASLSTFHKLVGA
jgi:hypothetical protein